MNVLHVDPEQAWGGGEVQVATLLRELAARGHRATVAAPPGAPLAAAAAAVGARVVPLRIRNHLDLPAALRLRRLVGGHHVVHFHTARAHAMAPACRGRGAGLVVTRRMDYTPAGGAYVRWLYNRAVDVVIAISGGVRDALVRAGVRPDRIRVVPSGVDPAALAPPPGARASLRAAWGVGEADVLVAVVGALVRRKGHGVLLAAAARLEPVRCVRLVFCGHGPEEPALRRAAAALGDTVVFAGFRRDVPACLAAADVVAVPSSWEGLGVAALEAMAAGRPVVASRVGGLAEVVVDGETGLLVPPGDPVALADALAVLVADRGRRERLGAAGRARVLARYTGAQMAAGTLACYQQAACGG